MSNNDDWMREGKTITGRLLSEIGLASRSWAHFEAINGEDEKKRAVFRDALNHLEHNGTIASLMRIFARDTLMALFRISDPDGTDRLTLPAISRLLNNRSFVEQRIANVPQLFPGFLELEAASLNRKVDRMLDCVPVNWKRETPPNDPSLREFRTKLRELRNAHLAHAGDLNGVTQPQIDEIRHWLELSDELVSASRHIFMESPLDGMLKAHLHSTDSFWDYAANGFIAATAADLLRRKVSISGMNPILERITVNPAICGGRPCIRGMRSRVSDVLDMLAAGASRAEILADYPYLEDEDITAALAFAARGIQ